MKIPIVIPSYNASLNQNLQIQSMIFNNVMNHSHEIDKERKQPIQHHGGISINSDDGLDIFEGESLTEHSNYCCSQRGIIKFDKMSKVRCFTKVYCNPLCLEKVASYTNNIDHVLGQRECNSSYHTMASINLQF